jgi:putative transposase
MEAEVSAEVGAGLGEVSAARTTHRNGYRPRAWETRVGGIELLIPKKRQGETYFPSFLEPRRPAEQAIVSVVMEAYVNGVSTRKVDRLVEPLGISAMSKDRVSALCRGLDERVEAFATARLRGSTPTSGWTPSTSRCAIAGTCARRPWSSPTRCTSPVAAR